MNLHILQKMQVSFSNSLSNQFTLGYGVKQGGVLSPILFTVYIDNLIKILKHNNVGCKVGNKFLGLLSYADDLTIICPKLLGIREMLYICADYAKDYNILFNVSKSKLIYFLKKIMVIVMTFYLCLMVARLIICSAMCTFRYKDFF